MDHEAQAYVHRKESDRGMSNVPQDQEQDQWNERAVGDYRAMQQEVGTLVDIRNFSPSQAPATRAAIVQSAVRTVANV